MLRREFLSRTGLALAAGLAGSSRGWTEAAAQDLAPPAMDAPDWQSVRAQFALSDEFVHMSAMLISSHPKTVRDAIEEHRRGMDANPLTYVFQNNRRLQEEARAAAGQYLGVNASDIALTDSTTMGVALVYNGLRLTPDQELSAVPIPDPTVKRQRIRLQGDVPSPIRPPSGCRFHTRCPIRLLPLCSTKTPSLEQKSNGHWAACHLRD